MCFATLLVLGPHGGPEQNAHSIDRNTTTVGRALDNDLVLADPRVSRQHIRIVRDGDRFTAEDLSRGNALRVNGATLRSARLSDGDRLGLGNTELVFHRMAPDRFDTTRDGRGITLEAGDHDPLRDSGAVRTAGAAGSEAGQVAQHLLQIARRVVDNTGFAIADGHQAHAIAVAVGITVEDGDDLSGGFQKVIGRGAHIGSQNDVKRCFSSPNPHAQVGQVQS